MSQARNLKYPCSVCHKSVKVNDPALVCTSCFLWTHNKCNNVDQKTDEFHQEHEDELFECLSCMLPFTGLNNYQFDNLVNKGIIESYELKFKPSPAQQAAIDKLNKYIEHCNQTTILEPDNEYEQPINCSYYSCEEFMSAKFYPK